MTAPYVLARRLWVKVRRIRAVPQSYRGVKFRSTLEADWAHTFDLLNISWSYEPIALALGDGSAYRPDFYLPKQRVWCEVKGPHDVRVDKPVKLARLVVDDPFDMDQSLVVLLRSPERGVCIVEGVWPNKDVQLIKCGHCDGWTFMDFDGAWVCRECRRYLDQGMHGSDGYCPQWAPLDHFTPRKLKWWR